MRTNIKYILTVVSFLLVVGIAPMASAGGDPAPSPTPSIISSSAKSTSSMSTSAEAVNGVAVTSDTTVLTFVQPQGATKKQMKGRKLRLKKEGCYNTSWTPTSDKWHGKCYPRGKVFVKAKDGWWRDPECWNKVVGLPRGKKTTPGTQVGGKVLIVRTATWSVTATATENGAAVATAAVACEANGSSASATSSSRSEYSAAATATASGSTREEATLNARNAAAAKALQMNLKSTVEGMAKVKAEGQAVAAAAAEAHCTGAPTQPPVTPAPSLIEADTINDVLINNTRTITVSGTVAPNHTAVLMASAKNGGSIIASKTQTVQGNFTVKVTYLAPSEVPSGGKDLVEFVLTQDDGQQARLSTNQFVVQPRPVTPQ